MEAILECCVGLDVHRDTVVACLLRGALNEEPLSDTHTFSTLPEGLRGLRAWLEDNGCQYAAMESTGVYWQPVYDELEKAFNGQMVLLLVNARHMKHIRRPKTDPNDSYWIAQLLRSGLLRGSFVPPLEIRELRDLTRYRVTLVEEANAQKNRVERLLQTAGMKLSSFVSDIFGVSGRNILVYLSEKGSIPPEMLKNLLKGKLKSKEDDIKRSLENTLSSHQQQMLQILLTHLDEIISNVRMVDGLIEERLQSFESQVMTTGLAGGLITPHRGSVTSLPKGLRLFDATCVTATAKL